MKKIYTMTVFLIAFNMLFGLIVAPLASFTQDDTIKQKIENAASKNSNLIQNLRFGNFHLSQCF